MASLPSARELSVIIGQQNVESADVVGQSVQEFLFVDLLSLILSTRFPCNNNMWVSHLISLSVTFHQNILGVFVLKCKSLFLGVWNSHLSALEP